jgi:murein DD-endopeptidase MepM/ murein hydrolase activator NlpD
MRIVWLIVLALLIGGGWWTYTRMERTPPQIGTLATPAFASASYEHEFRFSDGETGLRSAHVWLEAGGKVYELAQEEFPGNPFSGASIDIERPVEIAIDPKALGIPDGQATLHAEAHDFSWLDNTAHVAIPLTIDMKPPRVSLLTGLTYVRRGGTELAIYAVEDGVEKSGIQVGDHYFSGYVDPTDPKRRIAFYAIPAGAPEGVQPVLVAEDRAGNQAKVALVANVMPRAFPEDTIPLSDEFMAGKVAELLGSFDGSSLDGYLKINREMRKENDAALFELGQKSGPERVWTGAFTQMPNTHTGARFAERRSYVYDGKVVDTQTHMGFDFASTSHAPVPAANDGVVVFAGPLGIYGNTVVLDHGLGLFSLYGHLSEIGVEKGNPVSKGDALGKSGTTGLAGGDHLHYAMLLDGVFVDPIEWFDAKWIADHIEGKLTAAAQTQSESVPAAPAR